MKFIADVMLGGLAKYLRMLGIDTKYYKNIDDKSIIKISEEEDRVILTKDKKMVKELNPKNVYIVEANHTIDQTKEVVDRFDLRSQVNPLSRCLICNSVLREVTKDEVKELVDEITFNSFDEFYVCDNCKKVYWHSTHTDRMQIIIEKIINQGSQWESK
jgi:uncharacterized protein with PIN domain